MKILLHACCGPCSLEPTRLLLDSGHQISIAYMNSNIHPEDEYLRRLETLKAFAATQSIPVLEGTYAPLAWEETAGAIGDAVLEEAKRAIMSMSDDQILTDKNLIHDETIDPDTRLKLNTALFVDDQKRAARCRACYRLRFEEAAHQGAKEGFDAISTTLSVSPYQYTDIIEQELARAALRAGIDYHFTDYRPYYQDATKRSRALGMYRQNFCGCRISEAEAEAQRLLHKQLRKAQNVKHLQEAAEARAEANRERQHAHEERRRYEQKQARKKAVLKALREERKASRTSADPSTTASKKNQPEETSC